MLGWAGQAGRGQRRCCFGASGADISSTSGVGQDACNRTRPPPPSAENTVSKIVYLSMVVAIVVVPTRLSKGDTTRGPKRPVTIFISGCFLYYVFLRFVVARLA